MRRLLYSAALALTFTSHALAQQSLIWPTPEVHGTVRDLTHLPALPFIQTDPTNLQQQMWSQPGSAALLPRPAMILPDIDGMDRMSTYQNPFQSHGPNWADQAADRALRSYERTRR